MNLGDSSGTLISLGKALKVLGPLLGTIGALMGIYNFRQSHPGFDLTGEWNVKNTIESTSYHPYQGLNLTYRIFLEQRGNEISGRGEKWEENDRLLPPQAHTPITVAGRISGRRVSVSFEEEGTRRKSAGTFDWAYESETNRLSGTFTATAANARGPSIGLRSSH
jgi:hypothetical protein